MNRFVSKEIFRFKTKDTKALLGKILANGSQFAPLHRVSEATDVHYIATMMQHVTFYRIYYLLAHHV